MSDPKYICLECEEVFSELTHLDPDYEGLPKEQKALTEPEWVCPCCRLSDELYPLSEIRELVKGEAA